MMPHSSFSQRMTKVVRILYKRYGFTLIELLIAVAIIGVILSAVIAAVNPFESFRKTEDAIAKRNARELQNAAYQYLIKRWAIPNQDQIPVGETNKKPVCKQGVTNNSNCVNFDTLVTEGFINAIPRDKRIEETSPDYSGFAVYTDSSRITIVATELGTAPAGVDLSEPDYQIIWDTEETAYSSTVDWPAISALDSNTFVVSYADGIAGWARVGSIAGNAVSWETDEKQIHIGGGTRANGVCALSSTTFVLTFSHESPDHGVLFVGSYNGGDISLNTAELTFNAGVTNYTSALQLQGNTFVVGYVDISNGNSYSARVGTFNGSNNVTWNTGERVVKATGGWYYAPMARLDSNTFAMIFSDSSDGNKVKVRVGSYGGGTITWDTPVILAGGGGGVASKFTGIAGLSSTSFVALAGNKAMVGTYGGGTITWTVAPTVYTGGEGTNNSVAALDGDSFVLFYRYSEVSNYGTVRVGSVDGSSFVWDTHEAQFNAETTAISTVAVLDSDSFVVNYLDGNSLRTGTVRAGSVVPR